MSKISIIGVPMDLGADRRGVDMGPSALRYADLNEHLMELGHEVEDLGDLDVIIPETQHYGDPQAKYLKEIADACTATREPHAERSTKKDRTPLVLGGDHSIAVGTVSGMAEGFRRRNMNLGLLWFDAHADMNTPTDFTERQRSRHADGVDTGLRAAGTRGYFRILAQAPRRIAS